jgi:hypothetical protein
MAKWLLLCVIAFFALSGMASAASPSDVALVIGDHSYCNPHVAAVEYAAHDADAGLRCHPD